jgi:hypothetical protein
MVTGEVAAKGYRVLDELVRNATGERVMAAFAA